ncbi:MAG: 16S rRNA (adenine(1518)-N(6)/adenine(1519)-N(6))-dimethyltransferase RsmA [Promethearchaeota archaeon]|jgi:16S rRNA (adenine1518-N6/adenine1519-N6)-dimethyltransferase
MNYKEVKLILHQINLKPKKHLGQNFLIDNNILKKIISTAEISKNDTILEIGPGLGALTERLIEKAKKVYAVEIDNTLYKYLCDKFSSYDNLNLVNTDILNYRIPSCNKVISTIPYSITGPILEKVFFTQNPPTGVLIIEKTIADRIFISGSYKNFSRISISTNAYLQPAVKVSISRNGFYPTPKIALSLIKVIPKENINPFLLENKSAAFFLKFIAGIMPYKNKNIVNALTLFFKNNNNTSFTKDRILQILREKSCENKKTVEFQIEEFIELSKLFYF